MVPGRPDRRLARVTFAGPYDQGMAAYLANIGVNASHAARSPLGAGGRFLVVPIPEKVAWRPPMRRLRDADLAHLQAHAPPSWHEKAVHLDPDLAAPVATYGDNCRRAGRAFSLRAATPGDLIVFMARLHPPAGAAGFHLVGRLAVAEVLADVTSDPGPGWWERNAHVLRARATGRWDSFWVFRGTEGSGPLARARAFGRREAGLLLGGVDWPGHRSALQTIGSHTRAVRRFTGAAEALLRTMSDGLA
ncbi:MAG: hypothetical protein ACREPI_06825 [Candidatus Dormibacterales bacterium]